MSAQPIVFSPRKDLYGRRVVMEAHGSRRYGIVVDSHFESEEGPHHPRTLILVVEDEETHLPLVWEVPAVKHPRDWEKHNFRIRFQPLDTDANDLSALGLDRGNGSMADLLGLVRAGR